MITQQAPQRSLVPEANVFDAASVKHSPFVGVFAVSTSRRTGLLYCLVESELPGTEETCRRIQRVVEQQFRASSLSITSSLNNAIKAAHFALLQENRRSLSAHQVTARITCGVLRGEDFFIGQAGSGLAYVLGEQGLRRMAHKISGEGKIVDSLGRDEQLEVALYHHAVEKDDLILFASPNLPVYLSREEIAALMTVDRAEAESRLRAVLPEGRRLSALVIRPALHAPLATRPSNDVVTSAAPVYEKEQEEEQGHTLALRKTDSPWTTALLTGAAGLGQLLLLLAGLSAGAVRYLSGAVAATAKLGAESFQPAAKEDWTSPHEAMVFRSPRRYPEISKKQPSFRHSHREPLLALAGVLGVVVLMLVAAYLFLTRPEEQPREETFAQVLQQAKEITRQVPTSRLAAREYLQSAGRLVDRALQIRKDDPQALELRKDITGRLAVVNAAVELPDLRALIDLPNQEKGAESLSAAIVGGNQLYLLDRGADKVTYYTLDAAGALPQKVETGVLWRRGDQWGNITIGKLSDLVWLPAGGARQTEGVLLFDEKRSLFDQVPGKGASPLVLRDADKWGSFDGAAGFNGSLYVLDRKGNQVWRYDPTQNGFDSERRPMIEIGDLKDAVDIAVDGSIYILLSDGRIQRYASGLQVPFSQEEIDKPLLNPTAIFASSQTRSVYVADSGNQRVVVFGKDGKFQCQFADQRFAGLRGLYVDEDKHRLYVLGAKKLYLATLPSEAEVKKANEAAPAKPQNG